MNPTIAFAYTWLLFPAPLETATIQIEAAPFYYVLGAPAICPSNIPEIEKACRVSIDPVLPDSVVVLPTPRPDNRVVEETKSDRVVQ